MDDRQARAAVALLAAHYPQASIPDSTVITWSQQLREYEFEDAQWAIQQIASTSRRLPTLADVVEGIRKHRGDRPSMALAPPVPSRLEDRVAEHLSPSDDGLAFLDARDEQRTRQIAANAIRERRFASQPAAAAEWERVSAELGEDATPLQIAGVIHRRVWGRES